MATRTKRILIASPLHQKIEYFVEHQKSLDNLIIPKGYQVDRFYIVNDCDEIIPYLQNCQYIVHNYNNLQETVHQWSPKDIMKMVEMRNYILLYAEQNKYDYVFSVDTDLVLRPETLEVLLNTKEDLIAEAFWTRMPDNKSRIWYNASLYAYWEASANATKECVEAIYKHKLPGIYNVGMTGACILINKKVWKSGVTYDPLPYLADIFSEDRFFCVRAMCHGFQPKIDNHCPPFHLYSDLEWGEYQELLEEQEEEENNVD